MVNLLAFSIILSSVASLSRTSFDAQELTGDTLVDYINQLETTWQATKENKFRHYSNKVKWGLMGVNHIALSIEGRKELSPTRLLSMAIPDHFDSRLQWPHCPSLGNIRDQSACGSCWAFGAVEAMSDRICIASEGQIKVSLSADDLLSCCTSCGYGCDGGEPLSAWQYWKRKGIVSGSNHSEHAGCRPYPFPPCEHHNNKTHFPPCHHDLYPTPNCTHKCQPSYTHHSYLDDKHYGHSAYGVEDDVSSIQKEILTHGPVEVAFEVYEDFLTYKGGVYQHKGGKLGGGHAVKMIGWGQEKDVPYWIVANSWNTDWGENGFFRILRGTDECGIESGVVAGVPKINWTKHFVKQQKIKYQQH